MYLGGGLNRKDSRLFRMIEQGAYFPELGIGVHETGYHPLTVELVEEGKEKRVGSVWIVGRVEPCGVLYMNDQGGFFYTRGGEDK